MKGIVGIYTQSHKMECVLGRTGDQALSNSLRSSAGRALHSTYRVEGLVPRRKPQEFYFSLLVPVWMVLKCITLTLENLLSPEVGLITTSILGR